MMEPKAPYAHCSTCPLKDQPIVYGRGPDNPDIVIVGEGPDTKAVKTGVPFIGPSGQLLDKILLNNNIRREDVYVTNAVLCKTPGIRPPTANEVKHCRDRLAEEIKAKAPQAVLGLGAIASKALLGTKTKMSAIGLNTLRIGGAKPSELLDGIPVVATFHPSAALRSPDRFPSIVADVAKLTRPNIAVGWEPTKVTIADDVEYAIRRLSGQVNTDLASIDLETAPPFDRRAPEILCLGVSDLPGSATVYTKRVVDDRRFLDALNQAFLDTKWIMQNGKYDVQYLWGAGVPNARLDEDTLLMHYSTDERKGTHDLEQLATEFINAPNYKTQAKMGLVDDANLVDLPPETLYEYNATDADVTLRLFEPLRSDQINDGVLDMYYNLLIPGSEALARVEYHGIHIDQEQLEALDLELVAHMKDLERQTEKYVKNPRSPMQIKRAFDEVFDENFEKTNEATLTRFIEKNPVSEGADFARLILQYRNVQKEWSTYVRGMVKHIHNGRIHSSFLLHGTESGRLSSRSPNLQNIKAGRLRTMFQASEGRQLVSADYQAIELRVAASILEDEWLLEQFRSGRSIHKEVAKALFGEGYTARQYTDGKAVTFGIFYDRRAPAIAGQLRIPVRKAQRMIDDWKANAPGLELYWKRIRDEIKEKAYLTSAYGRKRRFWLVTLDNMLEVFREGYNFPIQSSASDITLRSLIRLEKIYRNTDGVDPVITVHDSLTWDVEEQYVNDVKLKMEEVMMDNPDWDVAFPVDFKCGKKWS